MAKGIYKIVEQNVNGCGEDCEIYIESTQLLAPLHLEALKNILKEVKATYRNDDFSTEDFVEEGVKLFNERFNVEIWVTNYPYLYEITF